MKPEVETAVVQLKAQFDGKSVTVREDGDGGAYVRVDGIDFGEVYTDATRISWVGFRIPFSVPFADVYPHHVRRDLTRRDGRPLGEGMSFSRFEGFEMDSVQVSRRSNHREAGLETVVHKLLKVIAWIRSRS